jgi:hypothetical protein
MNSASHCARDDNFAAHEVSVLLFMALFFSGRFGLRSLAVEVSNNCSITMDPTHDLLRRCGRLP